MRADEPQQVRPDDTLEAQIAAVLKGDREAYREVIVLCEARVRVILAAILPDRSSVDDLAQEVFVTAFVKLGNYRPGSDFQAWLNTIARNLALNERRRWFRQTRFQDKFEAELENVLDPLVTAFDERYEGDALEALRHCLDQLEEPNHSITRRFYFENHSTERIAQSLSKSPGSIRLILFRARAALAACLQRKGVTG